MNNHVRIIKMISVLPWRPEVSSYPGVSVMSSWRRRVIGRLQQLFRPECAETQEGRKVTPLPPLDVEVTQSGSPDTASSQPGLLATVCSPLQNGSGLGLDYAPGWFSDPPSRTRSSSKLCVDLSDCR